MKTRRLGASELEVPVIGPGCMVLPGVYGPGSGQDAIAALQSEYSLWSRDAESASCR